MCLTVLHALHHHTASSATNSQTLLPRTYTTQKKGRNQIGTEVGKYLLSHSVRCDTSIITPRVPPPLLIVLIPSPHLVPHCHTTTPRYTPQRLEIQKVLKLEIARTKLAAPALTARVMWCVPMAAWGVGFVCVCLCVWRTGQYYNINVCVRVLE